jgi:hypothetical protein
MRSIPVCLVLAAMPLACQGKTTDASAKNERKADAKSGPDTKANADAKPSGEPVAPPTEPVAEQKSEPAGTPPPGDAKDPLGQRFMDPPWFRKELFADAVKAKVNRTTRDEKGLFSSQILFDLPSSATVDDCVKTLMDKVGAHVPNLQKNEDAKIPGRIQITGSTDRYRVTMMCGEAQGTMRAFVSFEWTKDE